MKGQAVSLFRLFNSVRHKIALVAQVLIDHHVHGHGPILEIEEIGFAVHKRAGLAAFANADNPGPFEMVVILRHCAQVGLNIRAKVIQIVIEKKPFHAPGLLSVAGSCFIAVLSVGGEVFLSEEIADQLEEHIIGIQIHLASVILTR